MKKILLIGALAVGSINLAQAQAYGEKIGQTYYDLQSNYSSANRLARTPNGGLSATWTESCNPDPAACPACPYVTRGAGYNHWDGNTWIHGNDGTCDEGAAADYGVFSARVGWPEIMVFPDGKEMIIAHTPLTSVSRPQAGQGGMAAWTSNTTLPTGSSPTPTDSWPRAVNSGNYIHMVATCQPCTTATGVIGPLAYYRSPDKGVTWDIKDQLLPDMDASNFTSIGADGYAIHANGSNVAIVAGSGGNAWSMWKSTDNGTTFTRTPIRSTFNINDTININSPQYAGYITNDNFMAVLVDHDGVAHTWAGRIMGAVDRTVTPLAYSGYFPLSSEGLLYWNDGVLANMGPQIVVDSLEDVHPAGTTGDFIGDGSYVSPAKSNPYGGGLMNMASAALDANNNIYVVYSAAVEGTSNAGDSTGQSFRDLYVIRGTYGGAFWSTPINIGIQAGAGRTDFEEEVFPSVAHEVGSDNMLHMIFQHDDEPGLKVRSDLDPEVLNSIVYYGLDVTTVNWNQTVVLETPSALNYVRGMKAYPNPTNGQTFVDVDLVKDASVSVRVTNLLGQEVLTVAAANRVAGPNTIVLDMSAQPSGVYLYTVIADGFAKTQRLVKE